MTSAAEGGGGFKMLTVAERGGEGVKALLTSAKILKFWQKLFQIKHAFFFKTYFTSVVPTALLLQCNWPITGIRRVL